MGSLRIDPGGCQRICDLPDDLLLQILLFVPIKDAAKTEILCKRWRYVWKMLPKLTFKDDQGSESFGRFIDKSLRLHKAPILRSLVVELGPQCPVNVNVIKWVENAVNHGVIKLDFKILWTTKVTSLPKSLYTCDTLVSLTLSNQILVDVSFPASLPSLLYLDLFYVVYQDEDSLARLLSSSPVLNRLLVKRQYRDDNVTNFTIKVPSLKILDYQTGEDKDKDKDEDEDEDDHIGSLVIESPALVDLHLSDHWGDYCSLIENMPCLDEVYIGYVPNHDEKFLTCLSSARRLCLCLSESMVACCNTVKFSRLIDLYLFTNIPGDGLESFIYLLQNSPKLKTLTLDTVEVLPSSWNQPSNIPQCLSSHLEIVRWKDYEGKGDEKQLLTYILANSKCLKTVEISLIATCNLEECKKELESMPRISTSSRLIYSTPQADWMF